MVLERGGEVGIYEVWSKLKLYIKCIFVYNFINVFVWLKWCILVLWCNCVYYGMYWNENCGLRCEFYFFF